jgi:hypothetical protein
MWVGPPSPAQPDSLGFGDQSSSGKEALMTVYVGMDVHRKRSQVAIVDDAGVAATSQRPGQVGAGPGGVAARHPGRRDRRHRPLPHRSQAVRLGGADPTVRNSDRNLRHGHITKQARPGGAGSWGRSAHTAKRSPPFAAAYGPLARRRGTQIATVAIARRLLARCFHILKQVQTTAGESQTGRARGSACACNTAVDLTEQPGPEVIVMRTPPRGPNGCG